MRIDAHQHFWHPARGDYGWMPEDDPVLTRPYHPADLEPQMAKAETAFRGIMLTSEWCLGVLVGATAVLQGQTKDLFNVLWKIKYNITMNDFKFETLDPENAALLLIDQQTGLAQLRTKINTNLLIIGELL